MRKGYRAYLDGGKTERECVKETVAQAREAGYMDLAQAVAAGKKLKAGDKVLMLRVKGGQQYIILSKLR